MSVKTDRVNLDLTINGAQAGKTMKELQMEAKGLRAGLKNLTIGSAEFNEQMKKINAVEAPLKKIQAELRNTGGSFKWLTDEVKRFGLLAAGYLGFQALTSQFSNLINKNAELSDSLADVRKTTGLSQKGVEELNKEIKKIDTRTGRKELLDLAYTAGKLGITGKEDVLAFVRAADKINVALGRDLGKDALNTLGKLVGVFKLKEKYGMEDSLLKLGSAMNELGMSSEASEGNMSEFLKRMGGVAPLVKMTAAETLGLGATLDSLGQTAEVSGTALGKLFIKMSAEADKFAQFAGMTGPAFKQLMERDFMGAFIKVLEGVKGNSNGINELTATLGELGIEGGRVVGVLGTLSNNTEKLKTQIGISNKAFEQGTSVISEFNIKNETAGAKLEKLGKVFMGFVSSPAVSNFLGSAIDGVLKFLSVSDKVSDNLEQERISLNALVIQIQSTNDNQALRNKLISELQQKYPDFLGNIKAEGVSNEQLRDRLKEVNEQLINKIVIQKKQEDIDEQRGKAADFLGQQIAAEQKLAEVVAKNYDKYKKDLRPSQIEQIEHAQTLTDKATALKNALIERAEGDLFDTSVLFGKTGAAKDLAKAQNTLTFMTDEFNKANKLSIDMDKEKLDLMKRLKVETGAPAGAAPVVAVSGDAKVAAANQEDLAKAANKLKEAQKELAQAFRDSQKAIDDEFRAAVKRAMDDINELIKTTKDSEKDFAESKKREIDNLLKKQETEARILELRAQTVEEHREADIAKENAAFQRKLENLQLGNGATADEIKTHQLLIEELTTEHNLKLIDIENEATMARVDAFQNYFEGARNIYGGIEALAKASSDAMLAHEQKNGSIEKRNLKKLLDDKKISEEEYSAGVSKIDDDFAARRKEILTKQFKTKQGADAIDAAINTSVAVTRALATTGGVDLGALAASMAVAGALQVAAILAQPVPEFVAGGSTKGANPSFTDNIVNYLGMQKPSSMASLAWINEKGPEYITPNWMLRMPELADTFGMLETVRLRGYAEGGFTGSSVAVPAAPQAEKPDLTPQLIAVMTRLSAQLDVPIEAFIVYSKLQEAKDTMDRIKKSSKLN